MSRSLEHYNPVEFPPSFFNAQNMRENCSFVRLNGEIARNNKADQGSANEVIVSQMHA